MRLALDTNTYVAMCTARAETVALVQEAESVAVPFIVLGELRGGFAQAVSCLSLSRR